MTDLLNLPPGAVYTKKSGQATGTVTTVGDTIIFTSTCDSLQRLVYELEEEIERIRRDTAIQIKEEKHTCVMAVIKSICASLIGGFILGYGIARKSNK